MKNIFGMTCTTPNSIISSVTPYKAPASVLHIGDLYLVLWIRWTSSPRVCCQDTALQCLTPLLIALPRYVIIKIASNLGSINSGMLVSDGHVGFCSPLLRLHLLVQRKNWRSTRASLTSRWRPRTRPCSSARCRTRTWEEHGTRTAWRSRLTAESILRTLAGQWGLYRGQWMHRGSPC